MTQQPFRPVIRTQADLHRAWEHLMQPLGFSGESIWLLFIEPSGDLLPHVTEIAEAVDPPTEAEASGLVELLEHFAGLRPAFLRSRPGSAAVSAADRSWATALYAACRSAGVPTEVVHLATDEAVVAIPVDELAA